jgi:hypothetical protein
MLSSKRVRATTEESRYLAPCNLRCRQRRQIVTDTKKRTPTHDQGFQVILSFQIFILGLRTHFLFPQSVVSLHVTAISTHLLRHFNRTRRKIQIMTSYSTNYFRPLLKSFPKHLFSDTLNARCPVRQFLLQIVPSE